MAGLQVSLPASGEAGERVTFKVTQLWWGAYEMDPSAAAEVMAVAGASAGGGASAAGAEGPGVAASHSLYATGVPDTATLPELIRAFQPHGAIGVVRGRPGAAIVSFADAAAVAAAMRSIASSSVRVHGAALVVSLALAGR